MDIPDDIFTEPDAASDTLANLGPLRRLAGVWEGHRGVDLNPKADGPEQRDYYERIEMQPIDAQTNGPQLFYGLRYHVHINTTEEQIAFNAQTYIISELKLKLKPYTTLTIINKEVPPIKKVNPLTPVIPATIEGSTAIKPKDTAPINKTLFKM